VLKRKLLLLLEDQLLDDEELLLEVLRSGAGSACGRRCARLESLRRTRRRGARARAPAARRKDASAHAAARVGCQRVAWCG
jgi:hypothetical protein